LSITGIRSTPIAGRHKEIDMAEIGKIKLADAIQQQQAKAGKGKGEKPKPVAEVVEGGRGQKRQAPAGRRGSR
jgi:hypothetical protein